MMGGKESTECSEAIPSASCGSCNPLPLGAMAHPPASAEETTRMRPPPDLHPPAPPAMDLSVAGWVALPCASGIRPLSSAKMHRVLRWILGGGCRYKKWHETFSALTNAS
uniref:Uncharacterized protein n=1 Tax=Eutreptiella gymnastica TaxID=73025 RepID=A0A7S4LPL7_9EUGL